MHKDLNPETDIKIAPTGSAELTDEGKRKNYGAHYNPSKSSSVHPGFHRLRCLSLPGRRLEVAMISHLEDLVLFVVIGLIILKAIDWRSE